MYATSSRWYARPITYFGISSLVHLLSNDLGLRLSILRNVLANGADLPRHLLRSRLHTLCKRLQGNRTASPGAVLQGERADRCHTQRPRLVLQGAHTCDSVWYQLHVALRFIRAAAKAYMHSTASV